MWLNLIFHASLKSFDILLLRLKDAADTVLYSCWKLAVLASSLTRSSPRVTCTGLADSGLIHATQHKTLHSWNATMYSGFKFSFKCSCSFVFHLLALRRRLKFWGLHTVEWGSAIAQAVSRRLPTAAARVQTRVWSCGILCWTKVALGQVFSENFGFPCQSTFHLLLHNHLHYHPRLAQ
jgi:hypothetical protein